MAKSKNKAKISFIGEASETVTGSMYLLEYRDTLTMIGAGMHQCKDKIKQYQINSRNFKFKIKKLENILIQEWHIDHFGQLCHLFNIGCRPKVFAPIGSKEYFKIAFEDGLKITQKDSEYISKVTGKPVKPLYTKDDIDIMLEHIIECESFSKIWINEYTQIRYTPTYHVANSQQIEIFICDGESNYRKKILYGGDYGNTDINKPFLEPFNVVDSADVCLLESTYAMNIKTCNQKTRDKDIEKIQVAVRETCIGNKSSLIIPSFAYNRSAEILYELYMLYGDNKEFDVPILLDSPLAVKIAKMFGNCIPKKDVEIWDKILKWDNLHLISEWEDSEMATRNDGSKIVIACSGFCENGRIKNWLIKELGNPRAMIMFIGFSDEGSLATQIKDGKKKYIEIDGLEIQNKAKVMVLNSFSSHMQHNRLLEAYSNINAKSIYLVHGENPNRIHFAELLEKECRKKDKTTKIWVPYKDLVIEI